MLIAVLALVLPGHARPPSGSGSCESAGVPAQYGRASCGVGSPLCTETDGAVVCDLQPQVRECVPDLTQQAPAMHLWAVTPYLSDTVTVFGHCEVPGRDISFCCSYDNSEGQIHSVDLFGSENGDDIRLRYQTGVATDFSLQSFGSTAMTVNVYGRGGDDELIGSESQFRYSEALYGEDGDDFISGNGGDDLLVGGPGDDELLGDGGDDRLDGGEGDDLLFGGVDDDVLWGDIGVDFLEGGRDSDTLCDTQELDVDGQATNTWVGGERVSSTATTDTTGAVDIAWMELWPWNPGQFGFSDVERTYGSWHITDVLAPGGLASSTTNRPRACASVMDRR